MPLNDTKLRKIAGKPYDGPDEMPDGGGLSARISPKGVITFQLRYRIGGALKRMKIGRYGVISLREARDAAEEYRKLVADGKDPSVAKKMRLEDSISAPNVSELVNEWLDSPAAEKLVKLEYWRRALERHVIPYVGKMIADDMKMSHWESVFSRIAENDAPVMAGGVLVKMKQILNYAVRRNRISRNVLATLSVSDVGSAPKARSRNFNDYEIGLYWHSVDKTSMAYQNKLFMKLVFLSGCRGVELRLAKKADFDLYRKVWSVREENSKTRVAFKRGLSALSVTLLKEAFALYPNFDFVFPPAAIREDRPMANSVLVSLAGQIGDVMGISDWSTHDHRRTCKTKMAELGVAPHVSEKILGHKLAGMLAVYDQHDYIKEQIAAAELWADKVQCCSEEIKPIA
ncbi:tyrosine-type recombinase/integrase [Erwinia sp. BNK-24-b]|uniref:tyrosine-type recombinase/integrase n=1 Tax=unclassified Erwinia TaxID=2622719 RepID=UPI0039BFE8EA